MPLAALTGGEALTEIRRIGDRLHALGVPGAQFGFAAVVPRSLDPDRPLEAEREVSRWSDVAIQLTQPKRGHRSAGVSRPRVVAPPVLSDFRQTKIGADVLLDRLGHAVAHLSQLVTRPSGEWVREERASLAATLDALLDAASLASEPLRGSEALQEIARHARSTRRHIGTLGVAAHPTKIAAVVARMLDLGAALRVAAAAVPPGSAPLALPDITAQLAQALTALPAPHPRNETEGAPLRRLRAELQPPIALLETLVERVSGAGTLVQLVAELDAMTRMSGSAPELHRYVRRAAHLFSTGILGGDVAPDPKAARVEWLSDQLVHALHAQLDKAGQEVSVEVVNPRVLQDAQLVLRHPQLDLEVVVQPAELVNGSLLVELMGAPKARERYLHELLPHLEAAGSAVGLWTVDLWNVSLDEAAALRPRYELLEPSRDGTIPRIATLELPRPRSVGSIDVRLLDGKPAFPSRLAADETALARPTSSAPDIEVELIGRRGSTASWKQLARTGARYLTSNVTTGAPIDLASLIGPAATEALADEAESLLVDDPSLREYHSGHLSIRRWVRQSYALVETDAGSQVAIAFPSNVRTDKALELRLPLRLDPGGRTLTGLSRQDLVSPAEPVPLPLPSGLPVAPPAVRRAMSGTVAAHPLLAAWTPLQSADDIVRRWTREERHLLRQLALGLSHQDLIEQGTTTPAALKEDLGRITAKAGVREAHSAVAILCSAEQVKTGLPRPPAEHLDARERQALELLALGVTYSDMAPALGRASRRSVSKLVGEICLKLRARTEAQAIAVAIGYGLIPKVGTHPRPSIASLSPRAEEILRWHAGQSESIDDRAQPLWQNSLRRTVLDQLGFDALWQLAPFLLEGPWRADVAVIRERLHGLDPYTRQVVAMIGGGWSFADIGRALGKSRLAIQNEVRTLVESLGLRGELELARFALRFEIATPPPFAAGRSVPTAAGARSDLRRIPPRALAPLSMDAALWSLNRRERTFLHGTLAGWTGKEIAQALGMSESTVAQIQPVVYARLGVTSRTEMIAVATKLGLGANTRPAAERAKEILSRAHRHITLRSERRSSASIASGLGVPIRMLEEMDRWLGLESGHVVVPSDRALDELSERLLPLAANAPLVEVLFGTSGRARLAVWRRLASPEATARAHGRALLRVRVGQAIVRQLHAGATPADVARTLTLPEGEVATMAQHVGLVDPLEVSSFDLYERVLLRMLANGRTFREIERELQDEFAPTQRRLAERLGIEITREGDPTVLARFVERAVSTGVAWPFVRVPARSQWIADLTHGERLTLRLIAQGKSEKAVASALARRSSSGQSLYGAILEKLHLDEVWQAALALHMEEPLLNELPAAAREAWRLLPPSGRDALAALGRGETLDEIAARLGTTVWVARSLLSAWMSAVGAANESQAAIIGYELAE